MEREKRVSIFRQVYHKDGYQTEKNERQAARQAELFPNTNFRDLLQNKKPIFDSTKKAPNMVSRRKQN